MFRSKTPLLRSEIGNYKNNIKVHKLENQILQKYMNICIVRQYNITPNV